MQISKSKPILLALMMILMSATPFLGTTVADHETNAGTAAEMTITSSVGSNEEPSNTIDMWDTHTIELAQSTEIHVDYDVEVTGMTNGHSYDVEMVHMGSDGQVLDYQVSTLTGMGLPAQSTSVSTNVSATCSDLIFMTLTEYDGMNNEVGFKDLVWGIEAADDATSAQFCVDDTVLFWNAMDDSYAQDTTMHVGMNNPNTGNDWIEIGDIMLEETFNIYNSTFHESMDLNNDGNVSHFEAMVLEIDLFQEMNDATHVMYRFDTYHYSNGTETTDDGLGIMYTDFHLHGLVTEDTNNGLYGGEVEVYKFIEVDDAFNYDLNEDDTGTLTLYNFPVSDLSVNEWGDQIWISDVYYLNSTETFESYYTDGYETYGNGDFECADGDMIPFYMANDGTEDCSDGSDEPMDMNNDNKTDNYFECRDGSMVSMDVVNDYNDDCMEGEDEGREYVLDPTAYGSCLKMEKLVI